MVSAAVGVARCEVRIDQYEDVGESQRQEDRRGTLAVESGPPMRGSGGVADRGASPPDGRLQPVSERTLHVLYAGSAPCGEAFRIACPVCLPQAGSWAPPGVQGPCPPEPRQQTHFRSLGGSLRAPRPSSPWREPEKEI